MSRKSNTVFSGYTELDYEERKAVRELIESYDSANTDTRQSLKESYRSILNKGLGPVDDNKCGCCGR